MQFLIRGIRFWCCRAAAARSWMFTLDYLMSHSPVSAPDSSDFVVGIIPARLQSSRLPGKMLLKDSGKPLLQYAWEAACRSPRLNQVLIATDSLEIAEVATGF